MKVLLAILAVMAAVYLFMQILGVRPPAAPQEATPQPAASIPPAVTGTDLPGLPSFLEPSLAEAQNQGHEALGKWLRTWQKQIQDPRLAWIELDYVVLLNLKDRKAAVQKFQEVAARVAPGSPVYERLQKLAPAYAP